MPLFWRWLWYLVPGNPLLVRIVQNGSRRLRHMWVRTGYLGGLIVLVLVGLMSGPGMGRNVSLTQLAQMGTQVFGLIAYGQVLLVCLLAPLFMAGAIAAEQQGKTMDIMLTTPLSNLQIVLGSLLGRLFFVWALLASGLPLFSVLLVFGGVPISAVFVAFAVAAVTALLVGSVAVMLAVLRKGGRKAVFVFVLSVAGYLAVTYGIDRLLRYNQSQFPTAWFAAAPAVGTPGSATGGSSGGALMLGGGRTTLLTPLHPILVLEAERRSADYRLPSSDELAGLPAPLRFYLGNPLGTFTLLCVGVSVILLGWSSFRLRELEEGGLPLQQRLRTWLRRGRAGEAHTRAARTVWQNPVAWRESQTRGTHLGSRLARATFAIVGLLLAGATIAGYHFDRLPRLNDPFGGGPLAPHQVFQYLLITLLSVELTIIVLVAVYMSAGAVSREREDGTLDLMLTTPITPRAYLWGKLRGLVGFLSHLLVVPVLTVLMVSVYVMVGLVMQWHQATVSYPLGTVGTVRLELMPIEAALWVPLVLVPFVAFCVVMGMQFSLGAKGVAGAITKAVGLTAVPFALGLCALPMSQQVPFIGPVVNAFMPLTAMMMFVNPYSQVSGYTMSPFGGRISLMVAAVAAAGTYSLIVYWRLYAMRHEFDHTVRRLSGTA